MPGPLSSCGLEAHDPIGDAAVTACSGVSATERYATLVELATHPKGCAFVGHEALVEELLGAVSAKIDDYYGRSVAPCLGTRCFTALRRRLDVDALLRVDTVETRPCGCSPCDGEWTELDLDRVVVGSASDLPPWRWMEDCDARICRGAGVRITGVWGDAWPVHPGLKTVAIQVTAKLWQSMKSNGEVIANPADGTTSILVPDFTLAELALLPRGPVRYRASAA